jgi:transcription-repair coupling factor (superfamily II helicase)
VSDTIPLFSQLLLGHAPFAEAVSELWSGKPISVDGVQGGACALAAAAIRQAGNMPILILTAATEQAEQITDDLELFSPTSNNLLFPALENRTSVCEQKNDVLALADDLFGQRIRVLKQLSQQLFKQSERSDTVYSQLIIVAPILSLLQPVPSKELLSERTQTLQVGNRVNPEQLRRFLVESGYYNTPAVDLPGEFAVRGSILDLFAPDWEQPIRVEFFDDEIESIRRFDLVTQRSLENIDKIDLTRLLPNEAVGASLLDYLPSASPILLLEPREIELAARQTNDIITK